MIFGKKNKQRFGVPVVARCTFEVVYPIPTVRGMAGFSFFSFFLNPHLKLESIYIEEGGGVKRASVFSFFLSLRQGRGENDDDDDDDAAPDD